MSFFSKYLPRLPATSDFPLGADPSRARPSGKKSLFDGTRTFIWLVIGGMVLVMALTRVDLEAQYWLAGLVLATMLAIRKANYPPRLRIFYLLLTTFLSVRYFWWRTTTTLGYNGFLDFIFMILIYVAELYGIAVTLFGIFVNLNPHQRVPVPLDQKNGPIPTVDVFIPTYNESVDMLEITLRAALDMRYPPDRRKVYLLDDGGTQQKQTQVDTVKAAEARARSAQLQEIAVRHGAIYLTRERNEHAKAGNINSAMANTSGDLIAIFDADHIPTTDFLEQTVGFFNVDEKLFLVQTPHFFINPDPIEKNLNLFGKMPPENEMFYSAIQPGLDFWNAAFFCGSAALLRRRCLEEVGGIGGLSITEDAETAISLHALGYRSVYLNIPLIAGLQPETFASFIVQRVRWAQGMVQIFLLKNALRIDGLKLPQRLCYFSNSLFWFFGYARLLFLFAPVAYLVFGLRFYNASVPELFAYGVPQILAAVLTTDYLFGKYRWTFVSEIYELLQSMFSLPAILSVIRNPRAPTFNVTPKGEYLERDTISALAGPFYLLYTLIVAALGVGIWKLFHVVAHRDVLIVAIVWNVINLVMLNACIGVLYERRQRRNVPRVPVDLPGQLIGKGRVGGYPGIACRVVDLSSGGALLTFIDRAATVAMRFDIGETVILEVHNNARGRISRLPVELCNRFLSESGTVSIGIRFPDKSVIGLSELVSLVFGDSARWESFRRKRGVRAGILRTAIIVVRLGTFGALHHYYQFITGLTLYVRQRIRGKFADLKNRNRRTTEI